jgi:transcriptional regulator with XRE-family HTH domain
VTTPDYDSLRLATLRRQLGLSITDFSVMAGVSRRRVQAWMAGTSTPGTAARIRIHAAENQFHHQVSTYLAKALRSRTRPARLVIDEDNGAVIALVSAMLTQRGLPHVITDAYPLDQ